MINSKTNILISCDSSLIKKEPINISKENITPIVKALKKSEFFIGLESTTAIFKNS